MTVFCVSFRESQTDSWAEDQRGNNQNKRLDIEINDVKLFFYTFNVHIFNLKIMLKLELHLNGNISDVFVCLRSNSQLENVFMLK